MAMMTRNFILLASALCFLYLLGSAYGDTHFIVEGQVYCDTCPTQFFTRVSKYLEGAKVRLECKFRENGTLTYSAEGVTNKDGHYRIVVDGEHEEELSEVVPVSSPDPDCAEINKDLFLRKAAVVSLTTNNGIVSSARSANPLGFMKKDALPECHEVLRELGITPSGLVPEVLVSSSFEVIKLLRYSYNNIWFYE